MSEHTDPKFVRGVGRPCALCGALLTDDDAIAAIRLPSRTHGHMYFGAHASCLRATMRPEIAQFLDVTDVPPGLNHLLPAPA